VSAYPHVRVEDALRERARSYGEQARERVRRSVDGYREVFAHDTGWDWERVREEAQRYERPIASYGERYLDELSGIAEGAGVDTVVVLEARQDDGPDFVTLVEARTLGQTPGSGGARRGSSARPACEADRADSRQRFEIPRAARGDWREQRVLDTMPTGRYVSAMPARPQSKTLVRPMQERARQTRVRILETAAAAFARDGYEGSSLNEVIRASGLTKGAFYFHFGSKEELALAAFRHKQEQFVARIVGEAAEQPDALAELAAALRLRVRVLREDPAFGCVLRLGAELGATAGPGSEFASFHELTIGYFADLVGRGQSQGVIRASLDARAAGETIFAAMIGVDRVSRILSGRVDLERRTDDMLDLITIGLRGGERDTR